jgi:hypothetical protein
LTFIKRKENFIYRIYSPSLHSLVLNFHNGGKKNEPLPRAQVGISGIPLQLARRDNNLSGKRLNGQCAIVYGNYFPLPRCTGGDLRDSSSAGSPGMGRGGNSRPHVVLTSSWMAKINDPLSLPQMDFAWWMLRRDDEGCK